MLPEHTGAAHECGRGPEGHLNAARGPRPAALGPRPIPRHLATRVHGGDVGRAVALAPVRHLAHHLLGHSTGCGRRGRRGHATSQRQASGRSVLALLPDVRCETLLWLAHAPGDGDIRAGLVLVPAGQVRGSQGLAVAPKPEDGRGEAGDLRRRPGPARGRGQGHEAGHLLPRLRAAIRQRLGANAHDPLGGEVARGPLRAVGRLGALGRLLGGASGSPTQHRHRRRRRRLQASAAGAAGFDAAGKGCGTGNGPAARGQELVHRAGAGRTGRRGARVQVREEDALLRRRAGAHAGTRGVDRCRRRGRALPHGGPAAHAPRPAARAPAAPDADADVRPISVAFVAFVAFGGGGGRSCPSGAGSDASGAPGASGGGSGHGTADDSCSVRCCLR
mmetsp:Transcript_135409/g.433021  ORF Transcript_135409/g.433021 Transcript_135409/m.433021 type:complete len:391 (+) Transcript_135409:134-1306(+)